MKKIILVSILMACAVAQAQIPSLSSLICDELTAKAKDKNFSLKNLYALKALALCPDFEFDTNQIPDIEKRLFSSELAALTPKTETQKNPDPTEKEIKQSLKTEKAAAEKFKLYKQLRTLQRPISGRKEYLKTSLEMYNWAEKNYKSHPAKNKTDPEAYILAYEAAQLLAKALWTENNAADASKNIDRALKLLKKDNSVAELYFLKGRIEEESGKNTEAVVQYELALTDLKKYEPKILSFSADRILWLRSWIPYKEAQYDKAAPAFAELAASTQDTSEKSRALFFQARSLKFLKQDEKAKIILESISQNDFFGYYSLVSYRELGKKFPALKTITPTKTIKFDLRLGSLDSLHKSIFEDLIKYREFSLAEKAVSVLAKNKDDELNLALALAQNAKIYMPLFRVFAKLDNTARVETFMAYPELIFPKPYETDVQAMASKTSVPASLIYSIMKQESAFNEKARSHADAMGLMQVIPALAKQLSKKFEVPYNAPSDLFDASTNIKLGSYELMQQIKKQNGQLTYMAAAYNAGPNALANWLKNRKRNDILEFIEDIPYEETKTYVKLIARNNLFYDRISNRYAELEFPKGFLD